MSSGTVYQISSKSDDFSLRYGDLSIFKMTAVRHLGFYKFAVFIMWPLSVCHSASSYKISLKSDNPSKSYGQKSDFKDGGRRHLELKKKSIFGHVTVIGFNICCSVPNVIKTWQFVTEIWWFSDLQYSGCPPSWICYDVTLLHRGTCFRCPNIVVNF